MKRLYVIILALVILVLSYSLLIERYHLQVNEYPIYFENLPDEFDGFRILVLTDLHYGSLTPDFWIDYVFKIINKTSSDAIACCGDYVHRRNCRNELIEIFPRLNQLSAPYGVYMVLGNHDHWADNSLALELLSQSQHSVRNSVIEIKKNGASLLISGIGDFNEDRKEHNKALEKTGKTTFLITLAHNPDSADMPHRRTVDLFICGHTHGGQVVIPFTGYSPFLPVRNTSYDQGIKHNKKNETIFISRGIGSALMLPFRFNCPPEIPVIILKKGKPRA